MTKYLSVTGLHARADICDGVVAVQRHGDRLLNIFIPPAYGGTDDLGRLELWRAPNGGGAEPAKLSKPSKKPRKQLLFVVNGRLWRKADVG